MSATTTSPLLTGPPTDTDAEMTAVALGLEDVCVNIPDPAEITGDLPRVSHLTIRALQDNRLLYRPSDYGSAAECHRIARANLELVAFEMSRLGIWPGADSPRWFLTRCLEFQSLPMLADYIATRIHHAAIRRQMIDRAREIVRIALVPGPLDMQEVAKCLAS